MPPKSSDIDRMLERGDYRSALAECARTFGPSLGRFCMSLLGSQADAEEAVQETLIAAHAGFASFRGEGSLQAWLFGIARRQCARTNARRRRAHHLQLVSETASDADDPADAVAARQRAARLRAAMSRLKPSERETLLLRYQAGLSYREIAGICSIDEAAARKRASRGLANLRQSLSSEDL